MITQQPNILRSAESSRRTLGPYPEAIRRLHKLHSEVYSYCASNRISALHMGRYNEITFKINQLYLMVLTPGLETREYDELMDKIYQKAVNYNRSLDELYKDLMVQAKLDPSGNKYGELVQVLSTLDDDTEEDDRNYRELNKTYQEYISPSRTILEPSNDQ